MPNKEYKAYVLSQQFFENLEIRLLFFNCPCLYGLVLSTKV